MNISKIFEKNCIINEFCSQFQGENAIKLTKYLILIAIDYLYKYSKSKTIEFEKIKDLAKIIKSKRQPQHPLQNTKDTINEELTEIKSQITKLKSFCSNKKSIRSTSLDEDKKLIKTENNPDKLTIEELNNYSNKKSNKKPREITPKITETQPPDFHSRSLGKPPLTKHHLDDNEIKASLIEISNNLFASCAYSRKPEKNSKNFSSVKNSEETTKKLFSNPNLNKKPKKKPQKPKETAGKSLKIPNYLKNVKSKIKNEVEFHKRLFKTASQRSPDFQIKDEFKLDDNQMINEFITFGSSKNPSPISTLKFNPKEQENLQKEENSNILEIANSFLKSPFMQFVEGNNKIEEISKINFFECENNNKSNINIYEPENNHKNSRNMRKFPYNFINNSDSALNDVTQKFQNLNKESNFLKNDYSNLIKIEQMSDGDSISSTFSMLPTNEEIQGFFKKEFYFNTNRDSKNNTSNSEFMGIERIPKRESDIGKIVSVSSRRERENK